MMILFLTAGFLLTLFSCTDSVDNKSSNPKNIESISEDNVLTKPIDLDGEDGEEGQNGKRGKYGRNGGRGGNGGNSLCGNGGNGGNGGDAD